MLLPGAAGLLRRQSAATAKLRNLSYPLRSIEGSITPADLFFIRDHFNEPELSLEDWTLKVEGRVERPYELTAADLIEMPSTKVEAVLECAGNRASGSAASNGEWEGVSMRSLLEAAHVKTQGRFVMLEAADEGRLFKDKPVSRYSQVVPIEKCLDAASLVAYKLNGRFLPRGNGFPARAIFPGWYAMDSVKWLRRIVVLASDEPSTFTDSGMDRLYNREIQEGAHLRETRLTEIQVKSAIAWPGGDITVPAGKHVVWGFAWTGAGSIKSVSVSVDSGARWAAARLESKPAAYAWVRWSFDWETAPGEYVVMSRAMDDRGFEQPLQRQTGRKDGYEANWCLPVRCRVV